MNGECDYYYHGTDTDGTYWYECRTHGKIEISPDAPCDGYIEIPYTGGLPLQLNRRWAVSTNSFYNPWSKTSHGTRWPRHTLPVAILSLIDPLRILHSLLLDLEPLAWIVRLDDIELCDQIKAEQYGREHGL